MAITAAELLVKVGADTSDAESGLKSFSSKMKSAAGSMVAMGGALSAPLIGIGVSAVKTAATFERSMNVLGQVSGATGKQLQQMSDQALQLGADTVFSSNEAASGMVELAKAGMTTSQVMDAIPGVMDLAAAGAISVEDAASLTAATLNTFGLEAGKSAEVADVLAAAANASAADITDLAFGVQNAGSIFASSGQSVQTLATMMALLANNGLNASDAATSLKTMTLRLTAPTAQAAKLMKQLGIAVFNADGSMRDYHDIIADLSRSTSGLTDQQRSMALSTIFGADAMRAANIMVKEGATGYEAMSKAVEQQGAAAQMANAQNSGLSGAMEQISGSLESLQTKLALPFLDTLASWMGSLTDFVNKMGELPKPVTDAALAFGLFAAALGLTLAAIGGATIAIGAIDATILILSLSLLGVGLAVAALWAAWNTNFGNIQDKTQAVIDAINPLIQTLGTNLKNAAGYVESAAASMGVLLALSPQWQTFTTDVGAAATAASDFATKTAGAFENFKLPDISAFSTDLSSAVSSFASFATNLAVILALNPSFATFIQNVKDAATAVANFGTGAADALKNFKLPNISTLKTNVEMQLVATVQNLKLDWSQLNIQTGGLVTKVGNLLTAIPWTDLTADFTTLTQPVSDLINKEIKKVQDTVSKISTSVKDVDISKPATILNAGIKSAIAIVELIAGVKTDVLITAGTTLETFAAQILSAASAIVYNIDPTLLSSTVTDLVTGISDAIVALTDPTKLGDLGKAAGTFASTVVAKLGDALGAPGFGTDIGTAMGKATVAISSGASSFAMQFANALALTDWGKFSSQIEGFISGFISAFFAQIGPALWKESIFNPDIQKKMQNKSIFGDIPGMGDKGPTLADIQTALANFQTTLTTLTDIFQTDPAWVTSLLDWAATAPTWVTSLTTWASSAPNWLASLTRDPNATSTSDVLRDRALGSDFKWPDLPTFKWPELPTWTWPDYTTWIWPAYLTFDWPDYDRWEWPKLPEWHWPDMAMPGWVSALINALGGAMGALSSSGSGGGGRMQEDPGTNPPPIRGKPFAMGTSYWTGGIGLVGEHGPELVTLPQGSQIHSNGETMAMAAGGMSIVIQNVNVNNDMDIEQLVSTIARRLQQKMRL